jgi:hypothetical protein
LEPWNIFSDFFFCISVAGAESSMENMESLSEFQRDQQPLSKKNESTGSIPDKQNRREYAWTN